MDDPEQENQSDIDRICLIESYCPGMENPDFSQKNSQISTKSNEIDWDESSDDQQQNATLRNSNASTDDGAAPPSAWHAGVRFRTVYCCSSLWRSAKHYNYGLWNRFHLHGTVNDGPRSGRPRITTRDQDRYIRIQHLRDRFRTATLTAVASVGLHNRPVSWWTIRRRLHEGGLQAHRPFRGPTLSQEIRQNRLPWARWSFQRWRAWNCIGLLSLELPIFRMNRGECSQGILTPAMTLCASCRRSGMQLLNRPSET